MWFFSQSCQSSLRLNGKTFIVTGANTGIGKETARDLYWRGARVIMACRDLTKASAAVEDIKCTPPSKSERKQFIGGPGELAVCKLDLNSLASIRECAKHIWSTEPEVHVLINNAGVMMTPKGVTEDGFETQLGCNHLGHFLLTMLLLPKLFASRNPTSPCRIVNVSSVAHKGGKINFDDLMLEKSYSTVLAYCQSKLANVLFARELTRRLKAAGIEGINTYSLHPGVIATELGRYLNDSIFWGMRELFNHGVMLFSKTPELGAQTTIHCAVDENAANETGLYYRECAVMTPAAVALDDVAADKLWDESIKLVGLPKIDNLAAMIEHVSTIMKSDS